MWRSFGLWTLVFGLWTLDLGLWTLDFGLWTLDFGLWTLAFGLWTLDFVLYAGPWMVESIDLEDLAGVVHYWRIGAHRHMKKNQKVLGLILFLALLAGI